VIYAGAEVFLSLVAGRWIASKDDAVHVDFVCAASSRLADEVVVG
jgi:hypothetical protein